MDKEKKLKATITEELKKIKMKQADIESIIDKIEGLVSEDEEKTKVNYGTSCVRMEKNGKLLTEY